MSVGALNYLRIKGSFAAGLATVLMLGSAASLVGGFHLEHRLACTNHLRMIACAKGSYGLESKLPRDERVLLGMISPLLKGGGQALRCPSGGQYDPGLFTGDKETGDARQAPACSVHGSLDKLEAASNGFFAVPRPYFDVSAACLGLAGFVGLVGLFGSRRSTNQPVTTPTAS